MIPGWKETEQNCVAAARIMLGRKEGIRQLDLSASGFWRSFYALLFELPFSAASEALDYKSALANKAIPVTTSLSSWLLAQISASTLAYLVSLVAIFAFATAMGRKNLFPLSIIALNWGGLVLSVLMLPVLFILGFLPGVGSGNTNIIIVVLSLLPIALIIVALFRIIQTTLNLRSELAALAILLMMVVEISVYFLVLGGFGI